jgi:hypothetical protein
MAGLFGSAVFEDQVLGPLKRSGGVWRGKVELGGRPDVPLLVFGSLREPGTAALDAAREIARSFEDWRPAIEAALFDHYSPYAEAGTDGPVIATPGEVWGHVSLQSAAILKMGGRVTTELVYAAAWDEEHRLGARFQAGQLVELCGSV